jgi:hypothetical protein
METGPTQIQVPEKQRDAGHHVDVESTIPLRGRLPRYRRVDETSVMVADINSVGVLTIDGVAITSDDDEEDDDDQRVQESTTETRDGRGLLLLMNWTAGMDGWRKESG